MTAGGRLLALCLTVAAPLCLGATSGPVGGAAMDAMGWLARMNSAFATLDYHGVFSYLHGDDLATLQVTHVLRDGETRERLVHLNGQPREIIRQGERLVCVLQPGDEMIELGSSIPAGPFATAFSRGFDAVPESYTVALGEVGRIAGRAAILLLIRPDDSLRYGYRLWLDLETGLMLRSDLLDSDGRALEIFQFTTVVIGTGVPEAEVQPSTADGVVLHTVSMADADRDTARPRSDSGWNATWLPPGFMLAAWDIRRMANDAPVLNSVMYSDGLASFTVFIERIEAQGTPRVQQTARNGATVAVTNVSRDRGGDAHLVTVVGEVPVTTARRIAESVHPI